MPADDEGQRSAAPSYAIVTRPAAWLSAGVRKLLEDVEAHMRTVAQRFDRAR